MGSSLALLLSLIAGNVLGGEGLVQVQARLKQALRQSDFKTLDETFDQIAAAGDLDSSGNSVLAFQYNTLARGADGKDLDKWCMSEPDSGHAFMVRGQHYQDEAWAARGAGWSKDLNGKQVMGFEAGLLKSRKDLERAEELLPDSPAPSAALIRTAMGLQLPESYARQHAAHAIKVDPAYPLTYFLMQNFLSPKWGGSIEAELKFARKCAADCPRASSAILILPNSHDDIAKTSYAGNPRTYYADSRIWDEVEPIYNEYFDRFPEGVWALNLYAKQAWLSGHCDLAAAAFQKIGTQSSGSVWFNKGQFDQARAECAKSAAE